MITSATDNVANDSRSKQYPSPASVPVTVSLSRSHSPVVPSITAAAKKIVDNLRARSSQATATPPPPSLSKDSHEEEARGLRRSARAQSKTPSVPDAPTSKIIGRQSRAYSEDSQSAPKQTGSVDPPATRKDISRVTRSSSRSRSRAASTEPQSKAIRSRGKGKSKANSGLLDEIVEETEPASAGADTAGPAQPPRPPLPSASPAPMFKSGVLTLGSHPGGYMRYGRISSGYNRASLPIDLPAQALSAPRQGNTPPESQTQPESLPPAHSQDPFVYSGPPNGDYQSQLPLMTQKPYHFPSQDSSDPQSQSQLQLQAIGTSQVYSQDSNT